MEAGEPEEPQVGQVLLVVMERPDIISYTTSGFVVLALEEDTLGRYNRPVRSVLRLVNGDQWNAGSLT